MSDEPSGGMPCKRRDATRMSGGMLWEAVGCDVEERRSAVEAAGCNVEVVGSSK